VKQGLPQIGADLAWTTLTEACVARRK